MKAAEDLSSKNGKKTPRKSSVDSSYRRKFVDKLRSNSSFKKKTSRNDEASPSPMPYRENSASRPMKSVGRLDRAKSKQDLDFIPLCRKNTKNSDIVHRTQKGDTDSDIDAEFFSHIAKSQIVKTSLGFFDSKGTSSLSKSTQNESLFINKKVRSETKAFYFELEKQLLKKSHKSIGENNVDLGFLKRTIYNEFDELMIAYQDIELGKQIGKGATSEVSFGQYRFCPVAVKKVKITQLSPKQIMNIVNEIDCLRKTRHPNVISLFGIGLDQSSNVLIVTELCEQLSLRSFFKKFKEKIPGKVKLKIIFDIAKALFHIHSEKPSIVHRDVKPENIFLTSDLKAKLGDFGIAKYQEFVEPGSPGLPHRQGDTIATLHYMAPECMLKGVYTPASDIYAFGVLGWELLHEKEAFEGLSEFHLINSIVNEGYTLQFDSSVPSEISKILANCLIVDPDRRPSAKLICLEMTDHFKLSKK